MMQGDELLSTTEAARMLGITPHAVRLAVNRGLLPAARPNPPYMFRIPDLRAYATSRRTWRRKGFNHDAP